MIYSGDTPFWSETLDTVFVWTKKEIKISSCVHECFDGVIERLKDQDFSIQMNDIWIQSVVFVQLADHLSCVVKTLT